MSKRLKTAAKPQVPQTREQCAEMIYQLGKIKRYIAVTQAAMNHDLAKVTAEFNGVIDAKTEELQRLQDGVQAYCEAHRAELTEHGKTKSHGFVTGSVQWRTRPPSVRVTGVTAVIAALRERGLARLIRSKEEINKEAVLNEPALVADVPGIAIKTGDEDFVITPIEQELS